MSEQDEDIAFLLLRAGSAGSCSLRSDRWTGESSNAIVAVAYGGQQTVMPWDRNDYAACVRTVRRLPKHRQTPAVKEALRKAKEAYLAHNPEDASSLARRAARLKWEEERTKQQTKRRRRWA